MCFPAFVFFGFCSVPGRPFIGAGGLRVTGITGYLHNAVVWITVSARDTATDGSSDRSAGHRTNSKARKCCKAHPRLILSV